MASFKDKQSTLTSHHPTVTQLSGVTDYLLIAVSTRLVTALQQVFDAINHRL
ncbi:MAG: hypothetical protein L0I48_04960 [Lactococcus plantarum]|nr:hypothetical protein [Lactococcus plantarum]MDN6070529.1 hypothetical protein [Lactococcus plantarum]MDN6084504.1 hypothetical protein [Lactococcus plantarum]